MKQYSRAFVFANGSVQDLKATGAQIRSSDLLIAVDGGLKYLIALGKMPRILIGDLDSVPAKEVTRLEKENVEINRFPTHKDETDLELALGMLDEFKVSVAILVGATGDRLDHTLGNIHLLTKYQCSFHLSLDDGKQEAFLIQERATIQGGPNDIVSLIPLEGKVSGITTHDLLYPLKNESLFLGSTRGISNVMLGKIATVQKQKGTLLCTHIRTHVSKREGL